jgi:quinoprotein glucose dehydrogenase
VPKSDVPGEESWPTQPFPTNPAPFVKQTITVDDLNPYVLTAAERDALRVRLANARNLGMFTPPALGVETIAMPGTNGGANWGTTAAHPTNGTVYVGGINVPSFLKLTEPSAGGGRGAGPAQQGQAIYAARCQVCHGATLAGDGRAPSLVGVATRLNGEELRDAITNGRPPMPPFNDLADADLTALVAFLTNPAAAAPGGGRVGGRGGPGAAPAPIAGPVIESGPAPGARGGAGRGGGNTAYPAGIDAPATRYTSGYGLEYTMVKPPYSTITAYDLNTGRIKWQVPAGEEWRAIDAGASSTGYTNARSGMVVTSAGLLFNSAGDGKVRAYDVDSGKVLWTGDLPAASRGVPAMYEVNGRQYLVVNATQNVTAGNARNPKSDASRPKGYVVFALPK